LEETRRSLQDAEQVLQNSVDEYQRKAEESRATFESSLHELSVANEQLQSEVKNTKDAAHKTEVQLETEQEVVSVLNDCFIVHSALSSECKFGSGVGVESEDEVVSRCTLLPRSGVSVARHGAARHLSQEEKSAASQRYFSILAAVTDHILIDVAETGSVSNESVEL
jgi:Tfp pilus assembly protein PilO